MGDLYVPLDVNTPDDPKILAAGDHAELVFYRALCLVKRCMSDGYIARSQLRTIGATEEDAAALCREKLWRRRGDGWVVPSYLKRNKSRAEIEEGRKADAERKRAWRATKTSDGTESRATSRDARDSDVTCRDVNDPPQPPRKRRGKKVQHLESVPSPPVIERCERCARLSVDCDCPAAVVS